jgi:hypothetical protein
MRLLRRIAAAAPGALFVAAALAVAACGGNEFVYARADASTGSEGPDASAGLEAGTGASAEFCAALRAYYARCQYAGLCDQRNLDNCSVDAFDLSDVARAAFIACQQNIACNRGGTAWVHESCVSAKLAVAVPTQEQAKLAQDYCAMCMQGTTTCSAATFYREGVIQATDGPGFDALLYNDTIVKMIDQSCVTGLNCVAFRTICEDGIIGQQVPPDACKD